MKRKGQYIIIAFSLLVLAVFVLSPAPTGLSTEAKNAIGIFACAIILWITNALPLSVTGLFVIALLPLLGVMPSKDAFALFGNSAVFFILGAFILAAAMIETGLSKRIALLMLNKFDSTPRKLLAGIMLTCAFLSFIMPEHAVAAMMFPVVAAIANSLDLDINADREEVISKRLARLEKEAEKRGIAFETIRVKGPFVETVVKVIQRYNVDTILIEKRAKIVDDLKKNAPCEVIAVVE